MKTKTILLSFLLAFLFTSCGKKNNIGLFTEAPCPIEVPATIAESGKFIYGYMTVPEFHAKPKGKTMDLAIAIHKCQSDSATHEPLILITGGPGMSDIDAFVPMMFGELGNLFLSNRDIVIIELRGLKYSKPNLITPEIENLQLSLLDKQLTAEETVNIYMDTLQVAYDRFTNAGVNLSAFNDYEIASDIAFVMEELGYEKFSVFGSSFGTLVCQHLLLNHSERLTSVVMNAVVDINNGFSMMNHNCVKTLEYIFESCEADETLNVAYPDLKNRFLNLISQLNAQPEILQIPHGPEGKTYEVLLDGNKLSYWLFVMMYYNTQLPMTISKLIDGDYSEVIAQADILFPMPDFSNGLSNSIVLSENKKVADVQTLLDGEYGDFLRGSGTLMFSPYFLNRAREVWKVDDVSQENILIRSDVPTLIYNGALDHVCPPDYARKLTETLPNARLYVFPGVAHSPIDMGMCGIMMMKQFIDNPTQPLDDVCVQEFREGFLVE